MVGGKVKIRIYGPGLDKVYVGTANASDIQNPESIVCGHAAGTSTLIGFKVKEVKIDVYEFQEKTVGKTLSGAQTTVYACTIQNGILTC